MRVVIVSDIHGNIDALEALSARLRATRWQAEAILVLGDLVDYGPAPEPVIDWVCRHAGYVVRGNHDHAMGTGEDCRSSPLFRPLAVATREYFRSRLGPDALTWLATLTTSIGQPAGCNASDSRTWSPIQCRQ
jgi:protein phosphatase